MSITGFRAKNHPQQTAKRGDSLFPELTDPTDDVDDRRTDPGVFAMLDGQYHFTVDVAASADNSKCERYYTKESNGLGQSWAGERVWCNPPFSDIRPWVAKAHSSDARLVVMLLPANRTEQPWWQEIVEPNRDRGGRLSVRFLAGRLRFGQARGETSEKGNRPPFGCCLLIWAARAPDPKIEGDH